jgi:tetratricopeptide (TPR) repeat protein
MSRAIDNLMDLGRKGDAEELLTSAREGAVGDHPYQLFFQAEAAGYLDQDLKRRERLLKEAVAADEGDGFLLCNLAICHLSAERLGKARRLMDRALACQPDSPDIMRYQGLICSIRGRESKAMQWYGRALAVNAADNDALRQTGVSLSKLGREREAIDWYRRALEACETDYDAMRQMGISFAMLGEYETGLKWLNLALTVNPADRESSRNIRLVKRKQSGVDDTFPMSLLTRFARMLTLSWRRFVDLLG